MTTPSNDKSFLKMVIEEFGEVLVHHIVFKNKDSAVSFFSSLSFIKQTSQGPSMPSHIKAFLLEASDGVSLSIAGKLKAEESLEIRRKCLSASIKDEFYAIGKGQAVIAQNVNDQLSSDKNAAMQQQVHLKSDVQVYGGAHTLKSKSKTVAVLLAVFGSFWTWCYTYKKDAWKFWLNLGLSVISIGYWLPVAWIWAIVDAARRPKEFYANFNQLVLGQASSIPTQAMPPLISQQRSVENEGQVSTNIAGAASGARNVVTPAATQEIVLATIVRVSDVLWGGFLSLHLTNRRIIVESVVGTGATVAATLAGGIVGTLIADNVATKKAQKLISEDRSIDQILGSTTKNYALNYDDISDIVLKRKALPIGCSRCKIQSKQKNVTFAFKRAMFDDVSAMFGRILPGKTTFK